MLSLGKAAEIFEHYIILALTEGPMRIREDMRGELRDAVAAFQHADRRLDVAVKPVALD